MRAMENISQLANAALRYSSLKKKIKKEIKNNFWGSVCIVPEIYLNGGK